MKKSLLAASVALALGAGSAQAAFFTPGHTGTITVNAGCFTFGTCVVDGIGPDDITDNAFTVGGLGSGIAGDGNVGIITFTVAANGNDFTINSYNMDTYTGTAGGNFATMMADTSGAGGTVDDSGNMTLDLTGRTGIAQFFIASLGEQAWNLDTHGSAQPFCFPGAGSYDTHGTGTDVALDCVAGTAAVTVSGSALAAVGVNTWTGTVASAGNVGSLWGFFDGTPYSEIYEMTITTVPVPAAVWLFGSGLVGLVGVARRKKTA